MVIFDVATQTRSIGETFVANMTIMGHSFDVSFCMASYLRQFVSSCGFPTYLTSPVGRSENQNSQKINNAECFFLCLGI